jgi:DNA-binding HxlR family transcriptional regulator
MEKDGLISRQVHGDKPPVRVVYELTALCKTTIPVLLAANE